MTLQRQQIQGEGRPRQVRGVRSAAAEHAIDPQRRCIIVKFGRRLTAVEIQRYAAWLVAHPSFAPDFAEIVDLSGVEDVDLQADDFLALADQIDPFSPQAKRAFVANNSVQNHAARMHKVLRPEANIRIFPSFEDAERWIRE